MEITLGRILVGALALGAALYLLGKILKAIHQHQARRYWEARRQRGESGFCLHDPDTGNRIRVKAPPRS